MTGKGPTAHPNWYLIAQWLEHLPRLCETWLSVPLPPHFANERPQDSLISQKDALTTRQKSILGLKGRFPAL